MTNLVVKPRHQTMLTNAAGKPRWQIPLMEPLWQTLLTTNWQKLLAKCFDKLCLEAFLTNICWTNTFKYLKSWKNDWQKSSTKCADKSVDKMHWQNYFSLFRSPFELPNSRTPASYLKECKSKFAQGMTSDHVILNNAFRGKLVQEFCEIVLFTTYFHDLTNFFIG